MLAPFKKTIESVTLTFDFSNFTTSVSNPQITVISIGLTEDPNPTAILENSTQINGAAVLQQVQNGLDGALYQIQCLATMADGISKYAEPIVLPVYQV